MRKCLSDFFFFFFCSGMPLLECYRVDDTSSQNTVVGLPPSWVDTDVCRLYIGINPPQPGGTRAPSRSPPVSWWSKRRTDSLLGQYQMNCMPIDIINDRFSGPGRVISPRCVCVSAYSDNNFWTKWPVTKIFGYSRYYLGQVWRSRSQIKVHGRRRKTRRSEAYRCLCWLSHLSFFQSWCICHVFHTSFPPKTAIILISAFTD